MKLMSIPDWINVIFTGINRPKIKTVRGWIKNGSVPGKKIGGTYYIYYDEINTGNTLADEILRDTAA